MNRNLKGELLSTDELFAIARAHGISEDKLTGVKLLHNENLIYSRLLELTGAIRFTMFNRGELILDTRLQGD